VSLAVRRLRPERVSRRYRGGALLERFRGGDPVDDLTPEDWVGSDTLAKDGGASGTEGLARLDDGMLLRDAIALDPVGWLGAPHVTRHGARTGVLVKLLDAAQRLPVHAHPGAAFAREHLGSEHGKTEAWLVLDVRDGDTAEAWLGVRDDVDPGRFRSWIDTQDLDAIFDSLNRITLHRGDVVFVPGGVPHAMAGGTLFAELQEPTDYSLHIEQRGYPDRPANARHLGLGWERAIDAIDLRAHEPHIARELPPAAAPHFAFDREPTVDGRFAILIVTGGEGTVAGMAARRGDTFVVPASAPTLDVTGDLELLRCMGPA
jgi:mannose-6-phosphate isomerase